MPTGGVHDGEPIEEAAQRELAEEVGVHAGRLIAADRLCNVEERRSRRPPHLFLAHELTPRPPRPTTPSTWCSARCAFADALEMVLSGEIVDSMTIIAVLWADRLRRA